MLFLLLSLSPFIIFLILLLYKKTSLFWVTLITLILFLILSIFVWQTYPIYIFNAVIKGILIALDIFFIIFGAIFFLETLKKFDVIKNICFRLEAISKDHRVQIIFLAWLFENFLEGTAGFGTPSAIVAPLLVGIGLTPITAVIISLLGNSAASVFGAAGTPIRVGYSGLITPTLPLLSALYNMVGIIVPVFMLWILTANEKNRKEQFLTGLPFAIWTGVAFAIPSVLTVFLGQEFPSILGSVIAIILVLITTKLQLFIPEKVENPHPSETPTNLLPLTKVIFPYALLIIFLILGKIIPSNFSIPINLLIKHSINIFNPGFIFVLVGFITAFIFKSSWKDIGNSLTISVKRSIEPFLIIAFMSAVTQLMIYSNRNISGLASMLDIIGHSFKNNLLPLWAPFIGAFGSFITGSATISNLMFGNILASASNFVGINVSKILALSLVGAAAGKMIALADMIAAETVVGLKNQEWRVVKGVFIPCLIYVSIVGILGLLTI